VNDRIRVPTVQQGAGRLLDDEHVGLHGQRRRIDPRVGVEDRRHDRDGREDRRREDRTPADPDTPSMEHPSRQRADPVRNEGNPGPE
jgi:hypothetical protein